MTEVKSGTIWQGNNGKVIVLHTVELDGHTWVHYREHNTKNPTAEPREYSCYQESFLSRFNLLPE